MIIGSYDAMIYCSCFALLGALILFVGWIEEIKEKKEDSDEARGTDSSENTKL